METRRPAHVWLRSSSHGNAPATRQGHRFRPGNNHRQRRQRRETQSRPPVARPEKPPHPIRVSLFRADSEVADPQARPEPVHRFFRGSGGLGPIRQGGNLRYGPRAGRDTGVSQADFRRVRYRHPDGLLPFSGHDFPEEVPQTLCGLVDLPFLELARGRSFVQIL